MDRIYDTISLLNMYQLDLLIDIKYNFLLILNRRYTKL